MNRFAARRRKPEPFKPVVDYAKPVPIPYTCTHCGADRTRMVPLREVVHRSYVAPRLCPLCCQT